MYLKSRQLSERIRAVTEEAERLTDHVCTFEEFIALPFFGQIILRFNLNKDEFTAEEVWRFESILRMAAGEEFLTDFMGSVYRKAGFQTVDENDQEYIMVYRLQEPVPEVPRAEEETCT